MLFKTKQEAMNYAGRPYSRKGYLTIMENKTHDNYVELWHDLEGMGELEETLIFDNNRWAIIVSKFDVNDPKSLWESPEIYYIAEEYAEMYCARQYYRIKADQAQLESDNWTFKEYITREQLETRNAILKIIAKTLF